MGRKNVDKNNSNKVYVKPIKDKKRDIFLAYFWKYGYWITMSLALVLFGNKNNHTTILAISVIGFGVWSIIISIKPARHLVIAEFEGSRQGFHKNMYTHSYKEIKKMQIGTCCGGLFAIILGIGLLVL